MSIYRKCHVISEYAPLIWLVEDGYKRADFGLPGSSLLWIPSLVYAVICSLAFEAKQSGASITWKDSSFPDGTALSKLCLVTFLARRIVRSAVISPLGFRWRSNNLRLQTEN